MSFLKLKIFQWLPRHFLKSEIFQTLHNPTKREEFKISYQSPKGTLLFCQGHCLGHGFSSEITFLPSAHSTLVTYEGAAT